MSQSIVLLAYQRVEELKQVISSLKTADGFERFSVVAVIQEKSPRVRQIVQSMLPHAIIIDTRYESGIRARKCINGNLYAGLFYSFTKLSTDFTIIIEDDILIAPDFLRFCESMIRLHQSNPKFRAVNGFSNLPPAKFERMLEYGYLNLNYGVGWGWALPKETYERICTHWTGDEDEHWDSLIEPIMRDGFVVNPVLSRVMNVGFGAGATHTRQIDKSLQSGMEQGFFSVTQEQILDTVPYVKMRKKIPWREDCVSIDILGNQKATILFLIWKACSLLWKIRSWQFFSIPAGRHLFGFALRIARFVTRYLGKDKV